MARRFHDTYTIENTAVRSFIIRIEAPAFYATVDYDQRMVQMDEYMDTIELWCENNGIKYRINETNKKGDYFCRTLSFTTTENAMAFKLRWC